MIIHYNISLKAPQSGTYTVSINLFQGDKQFDSKPLEFITRVKSPVILKIIGALGWKKDFAEAYSLKVKGASGNSSQNVILDQKGVSPEMEARYLLPDYTFEFSLEKPFYKAKTLNQKVSDGINTLDFGILQPDIVSALLHPKDLWQLLPFSNRPKQM